MRTSRCIRPIHSYAQILLRRSCHRPYYCSSSVVLLLEEENRTTYSSNRPCCSVVSSAACPAPPCRRYFSSNNSTTIEASDVLYQLAKRVRQLNSSSSNGRQPLAAAIASTTTSIQTKATLRDLAFKLFELYPNLPSITATTNDDDDDGCDERKRILRYLAVGCAPNDNNVEKAVKNYISHHDKSYDDPDLIPSQSIWSLRQACTPEYELIIRNLIEQDAAAAMQFLLQLRQDIQLYSRTLHRHGGGNDDEDQLIVCLKQLDSYLCEFFSTWFVPGMLEIRRITYDGTSAACIETIAKQEAVHPMKSLKDLRNRLGPDRRVFGLFHPLLPANQPLVVLYVSLQPEIPSSMEQVHKYSSVDNARVATFYSISNLQPGLNGVGLGEFLIKSAVQELRNELQSLDTFVTLSPIPRFRKWLEDKVLHEHGKFAVASDELIGCALLDRLASQLGCQNNLALSRLVEQLANQDTASVRSLTDQNLVSEVLTRLAAHYLVNEKHRRKPLDGVAKFHIANGAEIYRINNWMADPSNKGWRNSFGVMLNYRYRLETLHDNQAQYEIDYTIPITEQVKALLS